ncbi:hypothetical protein HK104_010342 [Borealophlyctis nickersoniae]|nr:hypothetical protein HK104_010342 [Borealophlyctis nickersoniae]
MFRPLLQSRFVRRTGYLAGAGLAVWGVDRYAYSSVLERNLRSLGMGLVIIADYKLNFQPGNAEGIDQLHQRVAERILWVCQKNGGLYIKFGQQIASVPVLPPAYARTFKVLYDDAPAVPYNEVERIFSQDFDGKLPSDIFSTFSIKPLASASIAQVHRATLKDGTPVAVKIQKPAIQKQIDMDLLMYRVLLMAYEKLFDLPLVWSADYIEEHIRQETDFINEGRNAERAAKAAMTAEGVGDKVYVPKVFWDLTTRRVLSAEWIDGVRLNDLEGLDKKGWSRKEIMTTVVNVFADQIFREGFVHSDPHPGNILIRDHPSTPSSHHRQTRPQVVLLDHGLYVQCNPKFKTEYALLWKAMFTQDVDAMRKITEGWGIRDVEVFASATLQRPWRPGKAVHVEPTSMADLYSSQVDIKNRVREFLANTELMPKELIFLGRNMNLIRSNNRLLSSPVNRINLMANRAASSLTAHSWTRFSYYTFRLTLFLSSLSFFFTRFVQEVMFRLTGKRGGGFEAVMDETARVMMEQRFGIKIDESVFAG